MSDKQRVKKGILSSLMGSFGEGDSRPPEEAEGASAQGDPEAPTPVREAYEPGWYAYSAIQQERRAAFVDPAPARDVEQDEPADASAGIGDASANGGVSLAATDAAIDAPDLQSPSAAAEAASNADEARAATTLGDEAGVHEPPALREPAAVHEAPAPLDPLPITISPPAAQEPADTRSAVEEPEPLAIDVEPAAPSADDAAEEPRDLVEAPLLEIPPFVEPVLESPLTASHPAQAATDPLPPLSIDAPPTQARDDEPVRDMAAAGGPSVVDDAWMAREAGVSETAPTAQPVDVVEEVPYVEQPPVDDGAPLAEQPLVADGALAEQPPLGDGPLAEQSAVAEETPPVETPVAAPVVEEPFVEEEPVAEPVAEPIELASEPAADMAVEPPQAEPPAAGSPEWPGEERSIVDDAEFPRLDLDPYAGLEEEAEAAVRASHDVVERGAASAEEAASMDREMPSTDATPAEREVHASGGLSARSAAERRAALEEIRLRGLAPDEVDSVASLLEDPERDLRVLALETLAQRPDAVDPDVVRRALRDPTDEVRAAATRLASARSSADVPEVFGVLAERHWPLAQQAALDHLPGLVRRSGLPNDSLAALLSAVGTLDPGPLPPERTALSLLAGAVGVERLRASFGQPEGRERGAALLLLEEGSPEALDAVAARAQDADDDMRALAHRAAELRGEPEPEQQPPPDVEEHAMETAIPTAEDDMIGGLARALDDPGEGVRERAHSALGNLDRGLLSAWARSALGSEDAAQAVLGARVADTAGLKELAADVVRAALRVPTDARGPFARALAALAGPDSTPALISAVDSQDRPAAVRLLWQVGGRSALPQLRPLLQDSSAQVRLAALEVFGESADASAIEVAREVLDRDSSPVVRATAIQVIGRAGLDQREASLAKALADPDPDVRATAVELLPIGLGGQAAGLLLQALADEDERVWQAAVRHLAQVPERDRGVVWTAIHQSPPARREDLVATLEEANPERLAGLAVEHLSVPDQAERTLAISIAGRVGTPESVRAITAALQDPSASVRRTAAAALATLRSAEAIPGLSRALYDPDVDVRVEAVRALSGIDDDNVLDPLIASLKDPEVRVRDVAGDALMRWRSPAVARRLTLALSSPTLRRPAGEVLARMGAAAVDPLLDILLGDDPDLAGTVGKLLTDLVGPDVFVDRLGSMDPADRMRAVEALGAIGGEAGLDGLARALSDPVESIRIRAVTLLGESGDPRAFEAVKRTFLSDPVAEVVAAAETALQRLQPGAGGGDATAEQ